MPWPYGLVLSLHLPSSPLTASVDPASHHRKCKQSIFTQCQNDSSAHQGEQPPLAVTLWSSSGVNLRNKLESQKLGVQVSYSAIMPVLHFWLTVKKWKADRYFRRYKGNRGSMPVVWVVFWTVLPLELSFQERRIGGMATDLTASCLIRLFTLLLFQQGGTFGMVASERKDLQAYFWLTST